MRIAGFEPRAAMLTDNMLPKELDTDLQIPSARGALLNKIGGSWHDGNLLLPGATNQSSLEGVSISLAEPNFNNRLCCGASKTTGEAIEAVASN
jgi:hypothetical protein